MSFALDQFEAEFEPHILDRGLEYSKAGRVLALNEMAPGRYTATVAGSYSYTVRIDCESDDSGRRVGTVCWRWQRSSVFL